MTRTRRKLAPSHLMPETRRWWSGVVAEYELEPHHIKVLTLAAEAWDRCTEARERIATDGAFVEDRWGQIKAHPGIAIERDSRIGFARLLRELALDVLPPGDSRPPAIGGVRGE